MEFKVLEGSNGFIENELNTLKEEFNIEILGISSSPRDPQLGVGGICIIFTTVNKIDIAKIPIEKPYQDPGKDPVKKTKKPMKRNTIPKKKEK